MMSLRDGGGVLSISLVKKDLLSLALTEGEREKGGTTLV